MNRSDFNRTLDDLQLLKYKINNALLMCNVVRDDIDTLIELMEMRNREDKTTTTGRRDCTTTYTGDNYD